MPPIATALVYAAVLLPCLLYVWLAWRERPRVRSVADFFPLTRYVESVPYSRSTVSAGVSLATVILALVNLAPFLGLSLLITIGSYALSFVLLRIAAARILSANPDNDTLQGWLGAAYGSSAVRIVALLFSFVGYISIFSMELLVGVTVLEPFIGQKVFAFALVYLVFMVAYSVISGFRAIVATEQWQFRFVVGTLLVMVALVPLVLLKAPQAVGTGDVVSALLSWKATWPFVIGILCMNIPAPFADAATWQRLCATRSVEDARRGLARAVGWFIAIWGGIIVCASLIATLSVASGLFDPASGTLMTFLITMLAEGRGIELLLLFLFILGLFSAMITTADSLLLVSAQMFTQDLLRIPLAPDDQAAVRGLRTARTALVVIAIASFGAFSVFRWIGFDVVQLIFAIYGAHLALFPAVIAALYFGRRLELRRAVPAALFSTVVGFLAGWGAAIFGKTGGDPNWLYNGPAVALLASCLAFAIVSLPAWRRSTVEAG